MLLSRVTRSFALRALGFTRTTLRVNEWVTLSTSFAGAYISELYVDNDRVEGTIREPLRLRFAVTINAPDKVIEPFTEIGMTDDTVDARFGITWTHTHRRSDYYCD